VAGVDDTRRSSRCRTPRGLPRPGQQGTAGIRGSRARRPVQRARPRPGPVTPARLSTGGPMLPSQPGTRAASPFFADPPTRPRERQHHPFGATTAAAFSSPPRQRRAAADARRGNMDRVQDRCSATATRGGRRLGGGPGDFGQSGELTSWDAQTRPQEWCGGPGERFRATEYDGPGNPSTRRDVQVGRHDPSTAGAARPEAGRWPMVQGRCTSPRPVERQTGGTGRSRFGRAIPMRSNTVAPHVSTWPWGDVSSSQARGRPRIGSSTGRGR